MILWRPVGIRELALIFEADMAAFPPRLAEQPIFYPVLNAEYATQIAREWNAAAEHHAGYVTRFEIPDAYAAKFERRVVGARRHEELWVPAEQLGEFNAQLVAPIAAEAAYFGRGFVGHVPERFLLAGNDARQQFETFASLRGYSVMDVYLETQATALAVYLNFPFWVACSPDDLAVTAEVHAGVLDAIRESWAKGGRRAPLIELGTLV
jgi:hypothetical protein